MATASAEKRVVREGRGLGGAGRVDERAAVLVGGQRHRPRARGRRSRPCRGRGRGAGAGRRTAYRPGSSRWTTTASAPAAANRAACRTASAPRIASRCVSSGPAACGRRGRENEDGDGRHGPSLASGRCVNVGRVRAYVGLGANVGDAAGTLEAAIHALAALPGARLRGVSRLYATEPVGVVDQPEFRNAVAALDVPGGPASRGPARSRCSSRSRAWSGPSAASRGSAGDRARSTSTCSCSAATGSTSSGRPRAAATTRRRPSLPLTVPHAESRNRLFVLAPLADLAPGLVPPGWGESVATARDRQAAVEGPDAARPIARWDGERWATSAAASAESARAGRPAAGPGRTCARCRRTGPASSGRPSPASGSGPRRRRTARPAGARPR